MRRKVVKWWNIQIRSQNKIQQANGSLANLVQIPGTTWRCLGDDVNTGRTASLPQVCETSRIEAHFEKQEL